MDVANVREIRPKTFFVASPDMILFFERHDVHNSGEGLMVHLLAANLVSYALLPKIGVTDQKTNHHEQLPST